MITTKYEEATQQGMTFTQIAKAFRVFDYDWLQSQKLRAEMERIYRPYILLCPFETGFVSRCRIVVDGHCPILEPEIQRLVPGGCSLVLSHYRNYTLISLALGSDGPSLTAERGTNDLWNLTVKVPCDKEGKRIASPAVYEAYWTAFQQACEGRA